MQSKAGVWEEGKRVKWFEEFEERDITSGQIDFRELF
jgi:hypothetical protein